MIETIISKDIEFLENGPNNREKYFRRPQDFTRERKIDFRFIVAALINLARKSLSVEIEDLLERLDLEHISFTLSAFSHARLKLNSCFFKDWYEHQNKTFYEISVYKTWKGFRLIGIDGARGALASTPSLIKEFGTQDNQHGRYAMCQYLFGCDVLNNLILFSDIAPVKTSETAMLLSWLDNITSDMLCIYDRLFVSAALCYLHIQKNISFVMRCKLTHNQAVKDFVLSGQTQQIVTFFFDKDAITQLKKLGYAVKKGDGVTVRLIRVVLEDGEIEVLATSLTDTQKYPAAEFKALYFKRWGAETCIGALKNQLQIELASGLSPFTLKQDFYASVFTFNLQSLIINSVEQEVEQISALRQRNYKVNRNVTLGLMKGRLVRLFIKPIANLLALLQKKFIKNLTQSTQGQGITNPRNKKSQRLNGKYRPLTNYKRAI